MSFIAANTIDALRECGTENLPLYEAALGEACEAHPPPYGQAWYGDTYRSAAMDPSWLAGSLIANAEKEGEGSRKLWGLVARTPDERISEAIRQHAIDESRHALLYIAMCDLVFPDAMDAHLRDYAESLSPRFSSNDFPPSSPTTRIENVIDELIQMNIGEIRTRIHQLLLRPVITEYCAMEKRERLQRVLDSLLTDETKHIQYTARLINEAAENFYDLVVSTTKRRLDEFNKITLEEVGASKFVGE